MPEPITPWLGWWLVQLAPVSAPWGPVPTSRAYHDVYGLEGLRQWMAVGVHCHCRRYSIGVDIPSESIQCPSDLYAGA
jgi:hypothetical protein